MKIDSTDIGVGMMILIFIAGIFFGGWMIVDGFNSLVDHCEERERIDNFVGKQVIINSDTLTIVRRKGSDFYLNNDLKIDGELAEKMLID